MAKDKDCPFCGKPIWRYEDIGLEDLQDCSSRKRGISSAQIQLCISEIINHWNNHNTSCSMNRRYPHPSLHMFDYQNHVAMPPHKRKRFYRWDCICGHEQYCAYTGVHTYADLRFLLHVLMDPAHHLAILKLKEIAHGC